MADVWSWRGQHFVRWKKKGSHARNSPSSAVRAAFIFHCLIAAKITHATSTAWKSQLLPRYLPRQTGRTTSNSTSATPEAGVACTIGLPWIQALWLRGPEPVSVLSRELLAPTGQDFALCSHHGHPAGLGAPTRSHCDPRLRPMVMASAISPMWVDAARDAFREAPSSAGAIPYRSRR